MKSIKEEEENGVKSWNISNKMDIFIPQARPLPIEFPDALCHITSRGNVNIGVHDTNSDELLLDTRVYMIVDYV